MHYYKRNIGDYAKKTGRLTMLQHGAYTLLMDSCYDREKFPTLEEAIEWTWASTSEEVEAVKFVLHKFFTLTDEVYVQNRIHDELISYRQKSETNTRIAIERETKRRENSTKRAQVVHEAPPNQEPITNNQKNTKEKNTKKEIFSPPDWINRSDWDLWIRSRKKMNPEQMQKQVEKLEAWKRDGKDYAGALAQSAVNGWQGLFLPETKTQSLNDERKDWYERATGKRKEPRDITADAVRLD